MRHGAAIPYGKLLVVFKHPYNYERASAVWKLFECKTLGVHSDLYLKSDVLLSTDIYENFRSLCLEKYKLDSAHYFTSPSLSWSSMLRMTKVKMELVSDIEIFFYLYTGALPRALKDNL